MIEGLQVRLRPPIDEDMPVLMEMRNDIDLQKLLLAKPRPNTMQRVKEWLARRMSDSTVLFFIIADKQTNHCLGFVQLMSINIHHGTAQLGIALRPDACNKGCGREALTLCEDFARDRHHLRKVTLEVLGSNTRAQHVYERMGYRVVGFYAEHYFAEGIYHDVILMEKLLVRSTPTPQASPLEHAA